MSGGGEVEYLINTGLDWLLPLEMALWPPMAADSVSPYHERKYVFYLTWSHVIVKSIWVDTPSSGVSI